MADVSRVRKHVVRKRPQRQARSWPLLARRAQKLTAGVSPELPKLSETVTRSRDEGAKARFLGCGHPESISGYEGSRKPRGLSGRGRRERSCSEMPAHRRKVAKPALLAGGVLRGSPAESDLTRWAPASLRPAEASGKGEFVQDFGPEAVNRARVVFPGLRPHDTSQGGA